MRGDGVDPFVQRRVQLGDDALFPVWADEPEQKLRLVDRVLVERAVRRTDEGRDAGGNLRLSARQML